MSKPKLFVTPTVIQERRISEDYLESLKQWFNVHTIDKEKTSRQDLLQNVDNSFAILCSAMEPMNEEVVKAAGPSLKVISQPAAGYNNIDQEALKKHSIRVGKAGIAITAAAAEMCIALLLSASRRLVQFSIDYKANPKDCFQPTCPVWGLQNSVVGIVGAGNIGYSIARKVVQFDIKKLMYTSREEKSQMKILGGERASLEKVAENCDYLIISLAYNKETEKMINKKIIDLMKPTAILVNIARGGVVDQDYLVEALKNKKITGAALDVTTPEPLPAGHWLLKDDNVVLTPHVGGVTQPASKNAVEMAVKNIIAVLNNTDMADELQLK